ncbi:unnamed protein product [Effrenium voratum]|nr:unnamed protein product [Effrenium voratum]
MTQRQHFSWSTTGGLYWTHGEAEGIALDAAKNAALLSYAPPGSYVVRVNHAALEVTQPQDNVLWLTVATWRRGDSTSLLATLGELTNRIHSCMRAVLRPSAVSGLTSTFVEGKGMEVLSVRARDFSLSALSKGNSTEEILHFLAKRGVHMTPDCWQKVACWSARSIECELEPALLWWLDVLGLSQAQLAKVVADFPQILGYSIEQNLKPTNLKPTANWFLGLGLSQAQLAKVVAGFPQILGCSIEQNLKPTAAWILGLGLSQDQLAKVVAGCPQILGYSIEQNLKPTADWILGLGLSQTHLQRSWLGVRRF